MGLVGEGSTSITVSLEGQREVGTDTWEEEGHVTVEAKTGVR